MPLATGVPAVLVEVATLGCTLNKRAADVLVYFDRPGTSNGPTEAIKGRLEHLRGKPSASGTSPTTSPDHSSKPAASGPTYTVDCEEPLYWPWRPGWGPRHEETEVHARSNRTEHPRPPRQAKHGLRAP